MSSKDISAKLNSSDDRKPSSQTNILKQQNSFEDRYSAIINQEILKTTINMEVLQRQMNAFFPFSPSYSKSTSTHLKGDDETAAAKEAVQENDEFIESTDEKSFTKISREEELKIVSRLLDLEISEKKQESM